MCGHVSGAPTKQARCTSRSLGQVSLGWWAGSLCPWCARQGQTRLMWADVGSQLISRKKNERALGVFERTNCGSFREDELQGQRYIKGRGHELSSRRRWSVAAPGRLLKRGRSTLHVLFQIRWHIDARADTGAGIAITRQKLTRPAHAIAECASRSTAGRQARFDIQCHAAQCRSC